MADEKLRPIEELFIGAEAGASLALARVVEAAKKPLRAEIVALERENARLMAALEKAEAEREEFRRRLMDE